MNNHALHELPTPRRPLELALAPAGFAGRRVLVTGARGFVARHLVRQLLEVDAVVHVTVRPGSGPLDPRLRRHEVDLSDSDAVERVVRASAPHVVFHLAGRVVGRRDPDLVPAMLEDNVRAGVNLMMSAHRLGGCRVVIAGSVEEPRHLDEAPSSPYAASKLALTTHAQLFHRQWDLPVTVLRPAMVYGADQPDESKLVPSVITSMLAGHEPRLGSGTRLIDWIHVDDVCRAFLAAGAASAPVGFVAEVGSGTATSIADIVRILAGLIGYEGPLGFGALGDRRHDTDRIAEIAPAERLLGWHPQVALSEGLARTVAWYRRHPRCAPTCHV